MSIRFVKISFLKNFKKFFAFCSFNGNHDQILRSISEIGKIYQTETLTDLILTLKKFFKDSQSKSFIDKVLHRMEKDKAKSVKNAKRVKKYFKIRKSESFKIISIFSTYFIVSVGVLVLIAVAVLVTIFFFIRPRKKSTR